MAMDRVQLLLVGLPLFLFTSDIFNLFITSPPSKPQPAHHHHHHHHIHRHPKSHPTPSTLQQPTTTFPSKDADAFGGGVGIGIGGGHTVAIDFCSSCSYRGTAVAMKNMLETQFPGIDVVLANYPPPPPKRILSKLVPVFQFGVMGIIMAGDQIFPRLGMTPPPWYYSLRANRFGTISAAWLLGNFLQNYLQSSGAFEVSVDGELVFSKLQQQRFPGEIELRDLVSKKLAVERIVDGAGASMWS